MDEGNKDPQEENINTAPEVYITDTISKKCEHYFIRKSPTEFGCKKCTAGWIDNGEFQFKDGIFTKRLRKLPS